MDTKEKIKHIHDNYPSLNRAITGERMNSYDTSQAQSDLLRLIDELTLKDISFETEYQLEEFRKIEEEYFNEKETYGVGLPKSIMNRMRNLINQMEKEINQ